LSRQRSGRGANPAPARGAAAARPRPGVLVQAPKSDIYVVLLGIALGAIFLGCLFLLLILNHYGFKTKP
jgi:hypothetical protein